MPDHVEPSTIKDQYASSESWDDVAELMQKFTRIYGSQSEGLSALIERMFRLADSDQFNEVSWLWAVTEAKRISG